LTDETRGVEQEVRKQGNWGSSRLVKATYENSGLHPGEVTIED